MDRWPLKIFNFSRFWTDSPSTEPSPIFSYRFITVYTPYTEWRQSDKEVLFSAKAAELCDRDPLCVSGFFHLDSKRLDWRSRPIIRVNCGRRFRGFRQLEEFPPTLFCWQSNTTTVLFYEFCFQRREDSSWIVLPSSVQAVNCSHTLRSDSSLLCLFRLLMMVSWELHSCRIVNVLVEDNNMSELFSPQLCTSFSAQERWWWSSGSLDVSGPFANLSVFLHRWVEVLDESAASRGGVFGLKCYALMSLCW